MPGRRIRGAEGAGGTKGAMPSQILADQLTLSQPRGAYYAHRITTCPPGFSDLPTALVMERTVGAKLLKFNSGAAIKTKVLSKYHPCLPILIHSVLSVAFDKKRMHTY